MFSESIQSEYQQFSFCPWYLHWIYFRTVFIILLGIGFVEEHSKGILTCLGGNFSMFSLTCFKLMRRLYSGGQRGMISFHQQQNQLIQGFEKFRSKA